MLQSTLASLKSRVRSLRLFKKQKRKSDVPVDSSSDTKTEKAPDVAPTLEVSLPPPIDIQTEVRYERKMGDSEVSYYLPSRANGVNDMCVLFFFFFHPPMVLRAHLFHSGISISDSRRQATS